MGIELLTFIKNTKKEYKLAFIATFLSVILIHLYKFVNTLPNHDSVYNYYSDQNVLGSGRWALSLVCGISSYYDLPWINGLLSGIYIALTVIVIIAIFKISNPILICLIGALIAAAPATTETFFFMYTADGYMIAMLLAAIGVYLSVIDESRPSRWVLSCICICVSCGIYQTYVSFAMVLAICYVIDDLLKNNHDKNSYIKWTIRQAITYITSLTVYYIIWKLYLIITGTQANQYQGIANVGHFSIGLLINGIVNSIKTTLLYFLQWNVFDHGFTLYSILSIIFIMLMFAILITSVIKSGIYKRKFAFILFLLCLLSIIPISGIWHFVSDSVGYRAMMLQCLTLLSILTAILYERWAKKIAKNTIAIFLSVIIFNHALMANISYFYMNLCYERTYAEGVELMSEIHNMEKQYSISKIAVIGNRLQDVQWEYWNQTPGKIAPAGKIHMLSSLIETNLLFDNEHVVLFLKNNFGLELETVSQTYLEYLSESSEIKKLKCWPSRDSMLIVDDILVIKLSEMLED